MEMQAAAPAAPVASTPAAPAAAAPAAPIGVQVTAPAPAAATPPAPAAAAPAAASAPATFGEPVSFEPTGNPGLDMALEFVGAHGLGVDHPAMKAADAGDFGPLKALLAGKGIQGWEQYVALAEQAQKGIATDRAAKEAEIGSMCVSVAGSPEVWSDVLAWAGANAEGNERDTINSALAGGGLMAEAMAHYLVNGFRLDSGTSYEGKPAVNAAAAAAPPQSVGPLDPRAYGLAVAQLHQKLGTRMEGSPELDALNRRRAAYRG